ncbi:MAG TPA: hypothetical protein VEA79_00035 [Phenylobacterium sp.]|nr:hypothetical protein [Phenylobacterium sp.]
MTDHALDAHFERLGALDRPAYWRLLARQLTAAALLAVAGMGLPRLAALSPAAEALRLGLLALFALLLSVAFACLAARRLRDAGLRLAWLPVGAALAAAPTIGLGEAGWTASVALLAAALIGLGNLPSSQVEDRDALRLPFSGALALVAGALFAAPLWMEKDAAPAPAAAPIAAVALHPTPRAPPAIESPELAAIADAAEESRKIAAEGPNALMRYSAACFAAAPLDAAPRAAIDFCTAFDLAAANDARPLGYFEPERRRARHLAAMAQVTDVPAAEKRYLAIQAAAQAALTAEP